MQYSPVLAQPLYWIDVVGQCHQDVHSRCHTQGMEVVKLNVFERQRCERRLDKVGKLVETIIDQMVSMRAEQTARHWLAHSRTCCQKKAKARPKDEVLHTNVANVDVEGWQESV